jgi:hypothetical protein
LRRAGAADRLEPRAVRAGLATDQRIVRDIVDKGVAL